MLERVSALHASINFDRPAAVIVESVVDVPCNLQKWKEKEKLCRLFGKSLSIGKSAVKIKC